MKRRRLKKPIKRALLIILIIALCKILFIGETTTHETPAGSYQCTGGLVKVCNGSNEVADFLGVK